MAVPAKLAKLGFLMVHAIPGTVKEVQNVSLGLRIKAFFGGTWRLEVLPSLVNEGNLKLLTFIQLTQGPQTGHTQMLPRLMDLFFRGKKWQPAEHTGVHLDLMKYLLHGIH